MQLPDDLADGGLDVDARAVECQLGVKMPWSFMMRVTGGVTSASGTACARDMGKHGNFHEQFHNPGKSGGVAGGFSCINPTFWARRR
ncbi:MAG: hypothetical protein ACO3JG_02030 [Luteolibacter sp.]